MPAFEHKFIFSLTHIIVKEVTLRVVDFRSGIMLTATTVVRGATTPTCWTLGGAARGIMNPRYGYDMLPVEIFM